MAINKISAPGSSPSGSADWTAVVSLLAALVADKENPIRISGSNVVRGALFSVGGSLYLADSDTAISGTASDYVKLVASGTTVAASFVADLTGVSWNAASKGYYDASGNLYVFDEARALNAGAITATKTEAGNSRTRGGIKVFDASGTWRCPVGVTSVFVSGIGGGGTGGNGGSKSSYNRAGGGGGGGGGGAFGFRIPVAVVPGTSYAITLGAGVASSLGSLLSLAAGASGSPGAAGTDGSSAGPGSGGAGGAGGAGDSAKPALTGDTGVAGGPGDPYGVGGYPGNGGGGGVVIHGSGLPGSGGAGGVGGGYGGAAGAGVAGSPGQITLEW